LIRHAESEENRRLYSLKRCFSHLLRDFSLPALDDVLAGMEFFHFASQIDTNLSDIGWQQIEHVRLKLEESNFIPTMGIQLVVHSPLERAKQTSKGMLKSLAPLDKAPSVERVVELDLLSEKLPHEWLPLVGEDFVRRIRELEVWLEQQPESVIALVGHSEYFKAMLGVDFKFHNCEVWQVTFDTATEKISASGKCRKIGSRWTNLKRLYTCDVRRPALNWY
jgi:broad specificity phosphatase PhoE